MFASHVLHPSALYLTCLALAQHTTRESWPGFPSSVLYVYPNCVNAEIYGLNAEAPYCRKKVMGCLVQCDRLNEAGSLCFRVLRDGEDDNKAVGSYLPVGAEADGGDFSLSLVFQQVSSLFPEHLRDWAPTCDFFKVFLRIADNSSGALADCYIPLRLSSGGFMLSGAWQISMEPCGPLNHAGIFRGLVMVSYIFCDANSGGALLARFSISYSIGEDDLYGLRLTNKPLSRDNIGYLLIRPPDNIGDGHLKVINSQGIVPLVYPSTLLD